MSAKCTPAVYCLMSKSKRLMYIGSTTQKTRFSKHKSHYKRYQLGKNSCAWYSAFDLLECDDVEYHIIREENDATRAELFKMENDIIKSFKCTCLYSIVNKNITK